MAVDTAENIIAALVPSYAGDSRLPDFVELAKLQTSASAFSDKYELAVALRALHELTLIDRDGGKGTAGQVTSEREGEMSRSYSSMKGNRVSDLDQTSWGSRLKALIRTNVPGFLTRRMNGNLW